jgi:LPXTG-motif cell wall-anchored protein
MRAITAKGTKGFFLYLRENLPQVYDEVAKQISDSGSLQGFGAVDPVASSSETPPSQNLANAISSIADTVSKVYLSQQQADAQSQIVATQLARAQAGLPPLNLNPAAYGIPTAPSKTSMFSVTSISWIGIAAALGLLYLFLSRKRK